MMPDEVYNAELVVDEEYEPRITQAEAEALKPIQKEFMESYLANRDKMPLDEWLKSEMRKNLPEYGESEIGKISVEIISTLKLQEEMRVSLDKAVKAGRSKEAWFASKIKEAASLQGTQVESELLQKNFFKNLDDAVKSANKELLGTIYTQAEMINMNPNLSGYIAEQYHAQTFNLNAKAAGSPYRAEVLTPDSTTYAKNSVDIVIRDTRVISADGKCKVVRRYQVKYCKDAESTTKAIAKGDYRGQRYLVPEGQEADIPKKVSTVLEAPDGTKSKPLTYEKSKKLQEEAQSGNWNDLNWNEYRTKDLAIGIGKQAGQAVLMGAAVGAGFEIAHKVWKGEKIDGEELVEKAVVSGADFGVKTAAAGAIKAGAEKGMIKFLPKGIASSTCANIAFVAVENIKTLGQFAAGKLTGAECVDKMGRTAASTVAGIAASAKGAVIGGTVGMVLGPVGSAVGGFVGGTVGYMAGSKVGEAVFSGAKKIGKAAVSLVKSAAEKASEVVGSIKETIGSLWNDLASLFS